MVFLVGRRWQAVDAGRMSVRLIFRCQRRGSHLRHHETAVDPAFLYEKRGHLAICTFNRPEKKNALSIEMLVRMADAWTEADEDPEVRCIVLTGKGGVFCAGSDLGSMSSS